MAVPARIVHAGGGDIIAGRPSAIAKKPSAAQVLAEDPGDDRCGSPVDFELVQSLAHRGLGGIGVHAVIAEPVAKRRATFQDLPSSFACAAIEERTLILIRLRSPFDIPP